ncbi:hypothetical protein D3C80_720240 [compost metagenome]
MARAKGGGKQHRAARGAKARAEQRRRYDIAQAQGGQAAFARTLPLADVEQEMLVEQFGHAGELQRLEVELQQLAVDALGLLIHFIADQRHAAQQGLEKTLRHTAVGLVRGQLLLVQGIPLAVQTLQRALETGWGRTSQYLQGTLVEAGAVHLAPALDQVVRFVHQYRQAPLIGLGQAKQQRTEIEVIVVVAHHHVNPTGQLLAQVIGAYLVGQGYLAQAGLIEHLHLHRRLPCRRQAVVEALGQWAGLAMAGFVRVLARLVPGHQFQAAQGQTGAGLVHMPQCIESQGAAGGLGAEEQDLVQLLGHHSLEQGEQGAQGLADAGGGLGHQATTGAHGLIYRFGEVALAAAKGAEGKGQRGQAGIAGGGPGHFLLGPGQEALALPIEEGLQLVGTASLFKGGFPVAVHVQVHQGKLHVLQPQLPAQQPAVDLGLGPMQLAVVVGLVGQVASVRLDLFQAIAYRVVTVGAAAHLQMAILPRQRHLGLVIGAAPRRHPPMAGDAFLGAGRWREAQVEITDLGREFAQGAHRDRVTHAPGSAHCT